MTEPVRFRTREHCPVCGTAAHDTIWQGTLGDTNLREWLGTFHYSGDWAEALGDAPFELVRCTTCTMMYHRRIMDDAGLTRLYRDWADDAQARRFEAAHVPEKQDPQGMAAQMVKLLMRLDHLSGGRDGPKRVLDFGCGDGKLLGVARALGMQAVGVDVSDARSAEARGDGLAIYPDLDQLDTSERAPFDILVLSQVLEHVPDPLGLLRALRTRLHPQAAIIAAVPNASKVRVPDDFHSFTIVQPLEHVNAFTPETLRALGARAGLRPLRRPPAFFTTRALPALRSAANWVWQPASTDIFFGLDPSYRPDP